MEIALLKSLSAPTYPVLGSLKIVFSSEEVSGVILIIVIGLYLLEIK